MVVRNKAALAVATIVWLFCRTIAAAPAADRYPGSEWDRTAPTQAGWSASELDAAQKWSTLIGTTAVVIVQHGAIVASWGDISADILLNSARKSLLSALIGIAVGNHQIDLNDTLARLGIDDNAPSLTPDEKQATVADLLEARSGVYHGANHETQAMAALRPLRGSHPHGTFWYYNNWDFNVLGAIYEHAAGAGIFAAFQERIAQPIGMQDFDPRKCRYSGGPASNYPAYLFFASARDLARFGLLYLHRGIWGDRQIIPASWVDASVKPYSTTNTGSGYGYLWWTAFADRPLISMGLPAGSYFAAGNGSQFVIVIPTSDLVIVHLARMGTAADRSHREGVGSLAFAKLLAMILTAADIH
ncbi:MAG: serine hydrolase domain-containing protein [Acetobacteraceae bacterium]